MKKPRLTKTIMHPYWGTPMSVPAYNTNDGLHADMETYAESKGAPDEKLIVEVSYEDGSVDVDIFEHNTLLIPYKCYDDEEWEAEYRGKAWVDSETTSLYGDGPFTKKGVVDAVKEFLARNDFSYTNITVRIT